MAKSDCMVCHSKEKKKIRPSLVDIANKYPVNTKNHYLSDKKIIKGRVYLSHRALWIQ
jgi:cytochrome c